jgi:hypothetical protein
MSNLKEELNNYKDKKSSYKYIGLLIIVFCRKVILFICLMLLCRISIDLLCFASRLLILMMIFGGLLL